MNESRIENVQRRLSEHEVAALGSDVAKYHGEVDQLTEEKKVAMESFKSRIGARLELISKLTEKIRNGYEDVEIHCEVYFNTHARHESLMGLCWTAHHQNRANDTGRSAEFTI